MARILPDNDVQGHVSRLMDICQSAAWVEVWRDLDCVLCTFEDFNLPGDASDARIWATCQAHEVLLITGNRNAEGPDSLEMTIRQRNTAYSLPVLTLADPDRVRHVTQFRVKTVNLPAFCSASFCLSKEPSAGPPL